MSPPTVSSLSVSVTHPNDQHPNNNYTYAYTTIGGATSVDVTVSARSLGSVTVGGTPTSEVVVSNTGTASASGETTLTFESTFSAVGSGWSCTSGACTHPGPIPADGTLPTLTFRSGQVPVVSPPTVSSLSVSVTHPNDQHPNNNYTYAYTTIGGATSVDVTVSARSLGSVTVGGTPTSEVVVSNTGTASASGETTLTFESTFSAVGSGWSCTSGACTHPGPIPANGTLPTLTFRSGQVPVVSPPTVSSLSVSVTHPNDQHPNNNYTYVYTTIGGTTTTPASNLIDARFAIPWTTPGGTAKLKIRHGGAGTGLTSYGVTITLPTGLAYVPGTTQGASEPAIAQQELSWVFPTVDEARVLIVDVDVSANVAAGHLTADVTFGAGTNVEQFQQAAVEVGLSTLRAVSPSLVGQGQVTLVVEGDFLPSEPARYLLRSGAASVAASSLGQADDSVQVLFDTSLMTPAAYDLVVAFPSGSQLTLRSAVEVTADETISLDVEIIGPDRVRLNSRGNFLVTVHNSGTSDLVNVPVIVEMPPSIDVVIDTMTPRQLALQVVADMELDNTITPAQAVTLRRELEAEAPQTLTASNGNQLVPYIVGRVPAGQSRVIEVPIVPRAEVTADFSAYATLDRTAVGSGTTGVDVTRRIILPFTSGQDRQVLLTPDDCAGIEEACLFTQDYMDRLDLATEFAAGQLSVGGKGSAGDATPGGFS